MGQTLDNMLEKVSSKHSTELGKMLSNVSEEQSMGQTLENKLRKGEH